MDSNTSKPLPLFISRGLYWKRDSPLRLTSLDQLTDAHYYVALISKTSSQTKVWRHPGGLEIAGDKRITRPVADEPDNSKGGDLAQNVLLRSIVRANHSKAKIISTNELMNLPN
jgi:hypothetical protein